MAIIDNPTIAVSGGGGSVDETSALKYMLEHKTNYTGIAAGLTSLTTLPTFTQPVGISNFYGAFEDCSSLVDASGIDFSITATGYTSVNLSRMFKNCSSLTVLPSGTVTTDTSNWSAEEMFYGCTSLSTFPQLPCGAFQYVGSMFRGCTSLSGDITIPTHDGKYRWYDASYMFSGCSNISSITLTQRPNNIQSWDSFFSGCTSLTSISLPNNSAQHKASMVDLFNGCKNLQDLTSMQLRFFTAQGVDSAYRMFSGCEKMTTIPLTEAPFASTTSYSSTFRNCKSLISSPLTANMTRNCTYFGFCFDGCTALTNVQQIDMSGATSSTSTQNFCSNCPSLSNTALDNIMASLLTWGGPAKTLKYIGLSSAQATTATGLSNWSALSAAGWTTGY